MRIVFFGTPDYALPVLIKVHKAFKSKDGKSPIVAVVTQKPRPTGRRQLLTYSPVDQWAHKKGVPIFFESADLVRENVEAEIGILASFGQIIPGQVIKHFPHGILNIHPSSLPSFRGASPVQATIISGDAQAGVSIIKLDEQLDHGPIISQFKEEVSPEDTTGSLRERLFSRGADVLVELLPHYLSGKIKPRQQDHSKAAFTREIKKEDAFIPPKMLWSVVGGQWSAKKYKWDIGFVKDFTIHYTPLTVNNFIRAMQPWPSAWTFVQIDSKLKTKNLKRLKIIKSHTEKNLSLKSSVLCLDQVQLEGKEPVSWKQFVEGYPNWELA